VYFLWQGIDEVFSTYKSGDLYSFDVKYASLSCGIGFLTHAGCA